jgi:hypothetical protein
MLVHAAACTAPKEADWVTRGNVMHGANHLAQIYARPPTTVSDIRHPLRSLTGNKTFPKISREEIMIMKLHKNSVPPEAAVYRFDWESEYGVLKLKSWCFIGLKNRLRNFCFWRKNTGAEISRHIILIHISTASHPGLNDNLPCQPDHLKSPKNIAQCQYE